MQESLDPSIFERLLCSVITIIVLMLSCLDDGLDDIETVHSEFDILREDRLPIKWRISAVVVLLKLEHIPKHLLVGTEHK